MRAETGLSLLAEMFRKLFQDRIAPCSGSLLSFSPHSPTSRLSMPAPSAACSLSLTLPRVLIDVALLTSAAVVLESPVDFRRKALRMLLGLVGDEGGEERNGSAE